MVLVNNIKNFRSLFVFFIVLFFTACSVSSENLNKGQEYTKRVYKDINKDAILEASKKIFMYSGNRDFIIDSYRDSVHIIKPKLVVNIFDAYTTEDNWSIQVEEKNKETHVKLHIQRIVDFKKNKPKYFKKDLYVFFWKRLDFMLGLNKNWPTCNEYNVSDSAMCDGDLWDKVTPNKYDVLKNISFADKMKVRNIDQYGDDILAKDIELSVEEDTSTDILLQEDSLNEKINEKSLDIIDSEIDKLNKEVNENIDTTLDKIKTTEEIIKDNKKE